MEPICLSTAGLPLRLLSLKKENNLHTGITTKTKKAITPKIQIIDVIIGVVPSSLANSEKSSYEAA
jgi:hypothetical protein